VEERSVTFSKKIFKIGQQLYFTRITVLKARFSGWCHE